MYKFTSRYDLRHQPKHIRGQPIEMSTSSGSQRKPAQISRMLGEPLAHSNVQCAGIKPRAVWMGNPAIQEWGLCWRVSPSKRVEIACSIKLKGNLMPGHGGVMAVHGDGEFVDVMICLLPIGDPAGEPNYVAVSLPWKKCTEAACGDASMAQGMVFEGENSPVSLEDFMTSWDSINSRRVEENMMVEAQIEQEMLKGKKKVAPSRKKKDVPPTANVGHDVQAEPETATGEGSKKKRKAKDKADPNKEIVYTLDEALLRGNKLTTKTKDNEVEAIYKALDAGLSHAFPYRKHRLPGVIPSNRLHIAPDELKYRKIAKERLGQVSTYTTRVWEPPTELLH